MWELDCEESWVLKNFCFWTVVLEKTLESPLDCKEIQSVHSEGDQSWDFFGRNDAKAETPVLWPPHAEKLTHWKRLWCWEGLGAGGKVDDRGWDGWIASPTGRTWVWVNSGSWWWTGRPGMLRFMASQRVGHDWATELNRTELSNYHILKKVKLQLKCKKDLCSVHRRCCDWLNISKVFCEVSCWESSLNDAPWLVDQLKLMAIESRH